MAHIWLRCYNHDATVVCLLSYSCHSDMHKRSHTQADAVLVMCEQFQWEEHVKCLQAHCTLFCFTPCELCFIINMFHFTNKSKNLYWRAKSNDQLQQKEGNKEINGNMRELRSFFPPERYIHIHKRGNLRRKEMALNYIVCLSQCFLAYGPLYCLCNCCTHL